MSLEGTPMALTPSILIKHFFSPTSPAKYCFCPKDFRAYVWLVLWGYYKGVNFCPTTWRNVDCKTVVFFADASDGQYSNERYGASVKTARENGERR